MRDFVYVKQLVSDLLKKEKEINGTLSFYMGMQVLMARLTYDNTAKNE